jgi:hypothetical protein
MKEELFQLEVERLGGKISDADYAEQKSALEVLLKRALAREGVKPESVHPETVQDSAN